MLFAAVMTKIEGRTDDDLLRTYGFSGFPSLAILDASGEAITKSVKRDLPSMRTAIGSAGAFMKLQSKVSSGGKYDKSEWFFAQLGLGKLTAEEAKSSLATLGLNGADAKRADGQIMAMELGGLMRKRGSNPSAQILAWFKAGRRLPDGAGEQVYFDTNLVRAAMKENDVDAFKYSHERARSSLVKTAAQLKANLPRYERDLERFKDNERVLPQVERAMKNAKSSIAGSEKQIAAIDAFAKKIQDK